MALRVAKKIAYPGDRHGSRAGVMGFNEQTSTGPPRTFQGSLGQPPQFPPLSLNIAASRIPPWGRTIVSWRGYRISAEYEKRFATAYPPQGQFRLKHAGGGRDAPALPSITPN